MKRIIFDCDNTMGIKDCDVDDGLALLYLLGCPDAEVIAITTTYGNNKLEAVHENTLQMLKEIGKEDIPVVKGGAQAGCYKSEASSYLVKMVNKYPGEISILATGSLTNLQGAYDEDSCFFDKVKEIVLMGGITDPLVFKKREMKELNFSCDPKATHTVLTKGKNVAVITGNNCLKVIFTKEEYQNKLGCGNKKGKYILDKTNDWFHYNEAGYGIEGFYNWDVTAAVYLMRKEFFQDKPMRLNLSIEDLKSGYLRKSADGDTRCNLPEIDNEDAWKEHIYQCWLGK